MYWTESNIYDWAFCQNSFSPKNFIVDVRLGSKYASELFLKILLKRKSKIIHDFTIQQSIFYALSFY